MASSAKLSMLVRNVSTSSVANALVKPPIQIFGIDGRYATALYSAASKQKTLEVVEKDLTKIQSALKGDEVFKEFIANPVNKRILKSNALKLAASKLSLNAQTSNLLQLLAENGRLKKLDGVIGAFKTIMAAHRGEVTCEVTTASPLDAAQRSKLEGVLKSFLKGNEKTIQLTAKVDSTLIGGMVVSIGDRYVDMSVAAKIKKYTELISTPV